MGTISAICYNAAMANNKWIFVSTSQVLPWCKNNKYSAIGAFGGKIESWKGFNCTCPPSMQETMKVFGGFKYMYTCSSPDPCDGLNCESLGEGYVCVNNNEGKGQCVCDSAAGYREREDNDKAYCTMRECEEQDVQGPSSIVRKEERALVTCNLKNHQWQALPGYRLQRNNITNKVERVVDINECVETPNFCCDMKKARCEESFNTTNKCNIRCVNLPGSADCQCVGFGGVDFEIDKNTCSCKAKCSKISAWYLKCVGDRIVCDMQKLEKLTSAPEAPKGKVCTRVRDANNLAIEFNSALDLVKHICKNNEQNKDPLHCGFSSVEGNDIRELPIYNYDGPCDHNIDVNATAPKPICPDGSSAKEINGIITCPFFKLDTQIYSKRLNPGSPKGSKISLDCLPTELSTKSFWFATETGFEMFE